ncbi:hypothetical protein V6N12_000074 [Hibiscus sabdariffa]|uniref:Uncharacterized protein n=1 Tax=Hibiscus sabdariffa TaxID=183260 RepID=A0ABR2BFG2_9ROSI
MYSKSSLRTLSFLLLESNLKVCTLWRISFATYVGSVLQGLLELSSTCSWLDRSVSGQIGRTRRFHLWKAPTPNGLSRCSHFLADPSCKRYAVRSQEKLNAKESKWVFFLSSCVIRHKAGKRNVIADALSRRAMLLQSVETVVHYGGRNEVSLLACLVGDSLFKVRSGGNHDASSATPTAAAIDQGLNKSSGEPTGCPRGSRPFSNELLRMTAKHKRFSIIYINMYEPELGFPQGVQKKDQKKIDFQ